MPDPKESGKKGRSASDTPETPASAGSGAASPSSAPTAAGGSSAASAGPQDGGSGGANGGGSATAPATVAPRSRQYLIATRSLPGVAPMAADVLTTALQGMPDVTIVKRVKPRGLGVLSVGLGGAAPPGTFPEVIVAQMDPARGEALRVSAPPNVVVEVDSLLRHLADGSGFGSPDVAGLPPLPGVGVDIPFRITGTGGRRLAGATIYVYGPGFPAQGVTDANGEATVTLFGGPIESVQAVYVRPAADHWDRVVERPALTGGGMNTIQLRALGDTFQDFPQAGIIGWGQRMMKLDQITPAPTGAGVKIGIIDSGCDNTHPQLTHVTSGFDFTNAGHTGTWTHDTMSHGTHCAGIITGASTPVAGIRGFAPGAEVHILKVFPGGRFSDLIEAIDKAIELELDVVNLSLGSDQVSELVAQKLTEARQKGTACIIAAGNASGPVQFPATVPGMLAVAAVGKLNEYPPDSYHAQTMLPNSVGNAGIFAAKFSCFGPEIAVCGPGVAIVSTVPGGGYAAWDGTSMATPHITGMAALLLAHHPVFQGPLKARSEQRVQQLFELLKGSAVRYIADPLHSGAGLPDLQFVPGMAAAPQPAAAPVPAMQPQGFLGNLLGGIGNGARAQSFGAPGNFAFAPLAAAPALPGGYWGAPVNPAAIQMLWQLRAAGLI